MKFKGGIHPRYQKITAESPTEAMGLLERYLVPVSQHLGAPGKAIVGRGDEVKRGQALTEATGFVSAPVHAPTSGKVKSVKAFPHPFGNVQEAIEIVSDGEDTWAEDIESRGAWRHMDADTIKNLLQQAGLVGMGGATFPTHVKLSPPKGKKIDAFVLNAAECEPYLTSDHRLMLERPREILEGVGLFMKVLGVTKGYVGVEDNKMDALAAMKAACPPDLDLEFQALETKYPQGSEKHLIYALTGRKVPPGGLPMDVGCLVQNVATALASYEAVEKGRPLIERVATVTGEGIARPANVLFRVGTPLEDVIDFCGGMTPDIGKVIFGGPMMGVGQHTLDVPLIKGTSGILCLRESEVEEFLAGPCIKCGNCVDACPMGLVPSVLGVQAERGRFADMDDYHVLDCIECGSCAYVCPSYRPLVQLFRRGKAELRQLKQKAS